MQIVGSPLSSVQNHYFPLLKGKSLQRMEISYYQCCSCNASYYGKTKCFFVVQICEHFCISHLTGKKVDWQQQANSLIQEHLLCCNYSPSFEDFSILTRESNDFKLTTMVSLLFARDKPILNKADSSLHWQLF